MANKQKATLTGKFNGSPEVGRFAYGKTRRGITMRLLGFEVGESNEQLFTRVYGFAVDDDTFTVELKFNKHVFPQDSDGKKQEEALTDLIDLIEDHFGVGTNRNPEIAKTLEREQGILALGYITDLREDEEK